jgi:alkylhydroperoxidase/carboxymuconolactone decarboxylase family protein YurZ
VGQPSAVTAADAQMAVDEDLVTMRDRLTQRFAVMQSELGGAFYEMAIRDHVRIEVLMRRAADLQRVDSELGQVERLLAEGAVAAAGHCPACGAVHARGAAFCAQCAQPLGT